MSKRSPAPGRTSEVVSSADIRSAYDRDYYLNVCGGAEGQELGGARALSRRLLDALNLATLDGSEDVLDIGCGRGEIVAEAGRLGCRAVGVDYSPDAIALAKSHVAGSTWAERCLFVVGDATLLELGGRRFDVIFALDVLEHLSSAELGRLLGWIARSLKPGGRLIYHTSPNRYFYTIAYRVVRWLSLVFGRRSLPAEARCSFEQRMHINELTRWELDRSMGEAGLESEAKVFGMERVLEAIRDADFGGVLSDFLRALVCRPWLRGYTNSDLIGTAGRDRVVVDKTARLPPRGSIPLDHPVFFHEGWYVPVTSGTSPHRWTSPSFSLRGWTDDLAQIDLLFAPLQGEVARIAIDSAPEGFELSAVQDSELLRVSLRWPPTRHPSLACLRVPALRPVSGDPRLFGAYLHGAFRR